MYLGTFSHWIFFPVKIVKNSREIELMKVKRERFKNEL